MTPTDARKAVLADLSTIVLNDRQATHGEPEDSFKTIARFWQVYLDARRPGPLTEADVCWMMNLLKCCRHTQNPEHEDNPIDGAGYLVCAAGMMRGKASAPDAPVVPIPKAVPHFSPWDSWERQRKGKEKEMGSPCG